jgi:uncharacterized protein YbjT (DUF2867 family)
MLDQKRFGHDSPQTTGARQPSHRRDSVNQQDDQVAHRGHLTDHSRDHETGYLSGFQHRLGIRHPHLVKLSQLAADEGSPVRFLRYHAAVERRIRELGIGFTFLRPNLYFQGLLAFQPMIAATGSFVAPIGDARISAVDVRDIAAVAAIALVEEGHEGKTYTITAPAAVTHKEIASALSKAIGRPVAFSDVPPDAFASALKAAGVSPWQVEGLVEDYAHYARGEAEAISSHVSEVTGSEPRSVARFAADYASAFAGS